MTRRFRHAPRPIEPPCPVWCQRDHALDLSDSDGTVLHCREVAEGVEVFASDDLEAGRRMPTEIYIRDAECATGPAARRLALAILDAADFLDGAR